MNKQINFEDTIFILNVRMKMIQDLLRLDTETEVFLNQTLSDLEFISSVLEMLTEKLIANNKLIDRETEADNLSDAEWQLCQLLSKISGNQGPFPIAKFPEIQEWTAKFRKNSEKRQKRIDESYSSVEHSRFEPVVSQAEMYGLLGA
jgi:hypothetical protein